MKATGVVHEVGHMYGLKDEYPDIKAPGRTIAPEGAGSIMYSAAGSVLKRQIEDIVDNIAQVNSHLPCAKYKVEPK